MSVDLAPLLFNQNDPVAVGDADVVLPDPPATIGIGGGIGPIQCIQNFCIASCLGNWTNQVPRFSKTSTDMQMTRVPGGDILYVGLGTRRRSPELTTCSANNLADCNCNSPVTVGGAMLTNRSSDCGRTWDWTLPIDVTTIANGKYSGDIFGAPPGFDRQELYYDPFGDSVYMSVGAVGTDPDGVPHDDLVLFRSVDGGLSWGEPVRVSDRWEPTPMTSAIDGNLYLFNCEIVPDGKPTLYWSSDQGQSFQSIPVYYEENGEQIPCDFLDSRFTSEFVADIRNLLPVATISRGPTADIVFAQFQILRIAYSSVDRDVELLPGIFGDRQVMRIVEVAMPIDAPDLAPLVSPIATVRAASPASHVVQAAFVDTTRFDNFPPIGFDTRLEESAIIYWFEVPHALASPFVPAFTGITTRWAGFIGLDMIPPQFLARQNGLPDRWGPVLAAPSPGGRFMGDYATGAFFYLPELTNQAVFFLTQWPQSDQPPSAGPNLYLHYNVTSLFLPPL